MENYTLIKFDAKSQNFANRYGIQETDDNGRLVAVYDFDAEQLTCPGGNNASWDAVKQLDVDEYWDAVQEAEAYLAALGNK